MALLEEQNRQLRDAVQKLYEHVRAGHSLPALPASSTGEGRPLLHDIVAYVRALPMGVTGRHEQI
jgi:CHASE3 domain sensor protein